MTGAARGTKDAPDLRMKIYVRDDMIGVGKVELLRLVHETGSVSAAAREMGVDRRRARFLLNTLQRCFEEPLFAVRSDDETEPADVTPLGRELIDRFAAYKAEVDAVSSEFLAWVAENQRSGAEG